MGMVEWSLIGVVVLILIQLRHVWFKYRVVGQLLDILGGKAIQDRLFHRPANMDNAYKTTQQYIFLTRYVPIIIVGVFVVIGLIYAAIASGLGLSPTLSLIGAFTIAGVVTWLITFEAVPHWLYDWHLTVLVERSTMDLEAVVEALEAIEKNVESGKHDDLTESELAFVNLQVRMLETAHNDAAQLLSELQQQHQDLRSSNPTQQ